MRLKRFCYLAGWVAMAISGIRLTWGGEVPASVNDWTVVPGKRAGPITAKTTRVDLVRFFGAKNVQEGDVAGSDGGIQAGTIVFGDQPDASLAVLWVDDSP